MSVTESGVSTDIEVTSGPDELTMRAEQFVGQFETDQTVLLSNDQLKRIVLLQQVKALDLLNKKLENEINTNSNTILFDMSALNVSNVLNAEL